MSFAPEVKTHLEGFLGRLEGFVAANSDEEWGQGLQELVARYREAPSAAKDALSTRLMEVYKTSGSKEAFALLYELNHEDFLRIIYHHLRRSYYPVDAADILQEVFFNVYRYPFKFKPERPTAFRNWTHSIIRNTVLKHSRRAQRDRVLSIGGQERPGEEGPFLEPADERGLSPLDRTAEREAAESLASAWLLYLHYYQHAYRCLTPREKKILYLVEVDGRAYRDVAEEVGVKVENLKMMVFRARRKIHTIMQRKFQAFQSAMERRALEKELLERGGRAPGATGGRG